MKYNCPKCNSKVEVCGSDCYPNSGIDIECTNDNCDYIITLKCSERSNYQMETIKLVHDLLYNRIKECKE